jgi:Niemann-Pick C1 protein
MGRLWHPVIAVASLLMWSLVVAEPYTPKHEAGRCAIRGSCGKDGFFGPELPCPDNGLATEPKDDTRKKLVELCGPKWSSGPVCCEEAQVRQLLNWDCSDSLNDQVQIVQTHWGALYH